ncbi:MAG: DNA methylase [Clostridia bacterium]|nr:DNA methylase [Clostridia bacterium]
MADKQRTYLAIDLKSFYASVECTERGFDPLTTHLVVADASRTEKTICLAVSPSLKAHGISGRARLFEVVQRVKEVNRERMAAAIRARAIQRGEDGQYHFSGASFSAPDLAADPSLELTYCVAPPRMKLYEEYSTKVFSIYSKYISPEDIHVYSIDECFLDVTAYLETYQLTAHELAMTMIREVLYTTGITATAGIGTNLYLCKVAMDIVAKHVPADKDGVRIAELDEQKYRELLWCHTPLTDFWRVGHGIVRRMKALGCETMGDIARLSLREEDLIYDALGINAELLIDHAWGREPTEIATIKAYRPESNSLSSGQVLMEPYDGEKGKLIVREMTELLALDLVRKRLVTRKLTLTIGYDRESLVCSFQGPTVRESSFRVAKTGERYTGKISVDMYGRACPKFAHGTEKLDRYTSSARRIVAGMMALYDRIMDPDLLIRRVYVVAEGLIPENEIPQEGPEQMSLFVDYDARERQREAEAQEDAKERKIQQATLLLQAKFGKNALLKGMNLQEGATTILRNGQIGGHQAGAESRTVEKKAPLAEGPAAGEEWDGEGDYGEGS